MPTLLEVKQVIETKVWESKPAGHHYTILRGDIEKEFELCVSKEDEKVREGLLGNFCGGEGEEEVGDSMVETITSVIDLLL